MLVEAARQARPACLAVMPVLLVVVLTHLAPMLQHHQPA
jgi:hypothetical protein